MKAQTYSLSSILLAAPIFLFILLFAGSSQLQNFGSVEKVVSDQVHEVGKSIEEDFARGIEISAKRAILAGIDSSLSTGIGLDNSTYRIYEMMLNGTLNSNQSFIMTNNTLSDWQSKILSVPVIFNKSLLYSGLSLEQEDSFTLNFTVLLTVNVSDDVRKIRTDRLLRKGKTVSIAGFEDPVFSVKTNNIARRTFRPYPYPFYSRKVAQGSGSGDCSGNITFDNSTPQSSMILVTVNGSGISGYAGIVSQTPDTPSVSCYLASAANAVYLSNLSLNTASYNTFYIDNQTQALWHLPVSDMVNAGYYSSMAGPGVLSRLRLDLNSTQNGLESFVNTQELAGSGLEISSGKSVLDHQYFSGSPPDGQKVRGMPSWFRIDPSRAGDYNITELLES